jgi:dihydrolipoamide dehydrogenase
MQDIIIIGGGPGGYESALRAAQLGAKVTLIEKDKIGGTCLNVGCIPTKILYRHGSVLNTIKSGSKFGIKVNSPELDIQTVQSNKRHVIGKLQEGIYQLIQANSIQYIRGEAKLINSQTVSVVDGNNVTEVMGKNIIIATGSSPLIPSIPGIINEKVYTSDKFLNFNEVPERLLIIGGGVIGIEFAGIFNSFGSKVTVIDAQPSILNNIDKDLSKRLSNYMKQDGINIQTNVMVSEIKDGKTLIVKGIKKDKEVEFEADSILLAIGRRPNIIKGTEELGIKTSRNAISVDNHFMTNIPGIFAIGDVNGINMLAHVASHQGIEVVERIMGHKCSIKQDTVPGCIFTYPEIATVGATEEQLKNDGIIYKTNKFMFSANGKALSMGEDKGFVKVIESEGKIKGVHIIGPNASDLIHEAAIIVGKGLTVTDVSEIIHAHPTLSEAMVEATLGLNGTAIHQLPRKSRENQLKKISQSIV